jgi:type I restriction enzyme S subunit
MSTQYNYTQREVEPDNRISSGDLLVSWSATLDTFVWNGPEGVLNQHIFKVVPNTAAVTPGFLYWLLKYEVRMLADSQHAHGLAMMHINRGPFLTHPVLLPPLAEQHSIVDKVNELMTLCDQLEAAQVERERRRDRVALASLLRLTDGDVALARKDAYFFLNNCRLMIRRPEQVSGLRDTILNLAARGRLVSQDASEEPVSALLERLCPASAPKHSYGAHRSGSMSLRNGPTLPFAPPPSWEVIPLGALLQHDRGISYGVIKLGDEPKSGGVPTLRCSDVKPRFLILSNVRRVSEAIERDYLRTRLTGGEILINVRGTLGGVAVVPAKLAGYNVAREVAVVPISPELNATYVMNVMASPYFWDAIQEGLRGIAYKGLNLNALRLFPIPLPPLAEQNRIVAMVDELMAVCDELERSLTVAQVGRTRLLEAVLHEALTQNSVDPEQGAEQKNHFLVLRTSTDSRQEHL